MSTPFKRRDDLKKLSPKDLLQYAKLIDIYSQEQDKWIAELSKSINELEKSKDLIAMQKRQQAEAREIKKIQNYLDS